MIGEVKVNGEKYVPLHLFLCRTGCTRFQTRAAYWFAGAHVCLFPRANPARNEAETGTSTMDLEAYLCSGKLIQRLVPAMQEHSCGSSLFWGNQM